MSKARNSILLIFLIGIVIVSGCISSFNAADIAKANVQIKQFLADYPRATIIASLVKNVSIQEVCNNPQLEAKDYWSVKLQDPDSNTTILSFIDEATKQTVCVIKTGGKEKENPKNSNQDTSNNTTAKPALGAETNQNTSSQQPEIINQSKETNQSENVNMLFSDPSDYQSYIKDKLGEIVGVDIHGYGGHESMKNGKVYFIMWHKVDWKTYRFWAVEVDQSNGEIMKYKEMGNDGCLNQLGMCPNLEEIWWTPER